jgi:hypothetical protein
MGQQPPASLSVHQKAHCFKTFVFVERSRRRFQLKRIAALARAINRAGLAMSGFGGGAEVPFQGREDRC